MREPRKTKDRAEQDVLKKLEIRISRAKFYYGVGRAAQSLHNVFFSRVGHRTRFLHHGFIVPEGFLCVTSCHV